MTYFPTWPKWPTHPVDWNNSPGPLGPPDPPDPCDLPEILDPPYPWPSWPPWPTQLSHLTHLANQKCQPNMWVKKNWQLQESMVSSNWHQHYKFSLRRLNLIYDIHIHIAPRKKLNILLRLQKKLEASKDQSRLFADTVSIILRSAWLHSSPIQYHSFNTSLDFYFAHSHACELIEFAWLSLQHEESMKYLTFFMCILRDSLCGSTSLSWSPPQHLGSFTGKLFWAFPAKTAGLPRSTPPTGSPWSALYLRALRHLHYFFTICTQQQIQYMAMSSDWFV
jgi:hypothetical protein